MKHCMNRCDFCVSEPTCFDEPREDCPDFRPNDEYRRNRIEEQVKEHDERVIRKFAEWLENLSYKNGSPISSDVYIPDLIQDYEKEQKLGEVKE